MNLGLVLILVFCVLFFAGILTFLYYSFLAITRRLRKEFSCWHKEYWKNLVLGCALFLSIGIAFFLILQGGQIGDKKAETYCTEHNFFDVAERQAQADTIVFLQNSLKQKDSDLNAMIVANRLQGHEYFELNKGYSVLNKKYLDLNKTCLEAKQK